jgi:NDP-sugar pyrophosphorylase family protein
MNIVVPMAGYGSRFSQAGYKYPKPLIPVLGKTMIELVVENLKPCSPHRFIFICLAEHLCNFPMRELLEKIAPGCLIIEVSHVTQGAACTVLLAKELINNDEPLMIANCDQYVDVDINQYLAEIKSADGLIMTMKAFDNKWSFIEIDMHGQIIRVVEKEAVSDEATVGIYNYSKGSVFVTAAEKMIDKGLRVNNEFYVAPVYNEIILDGKTVTFFNVGALGAGVYGIGTPEDLNAFLLIKQQKTS